MINDGVTRYSYNYSRNTSSSSNIIYRDDSGLHNFKINKEDIKFSEGENTSNKTSEISEMEKKEKKED